MDPPCFAVLRCRHDLGKRQKNRASVRSGTICPRRWAALSAQLRQERQERIASDRAHRGGTGSTQLPERHPAKRRRTAGILGSDVSAFDGSMSPPNRGSELLPLLVRPQSPHRNGWSCSRNRGPRQGGRDTLTTHRNPQRGRVLANPRQNPRYAPWVTGVPVFTLVKQVSLHRPLRLGLAMLGSPAGGTRPAYSIVR